MEKDRYDIIKLDLQRGEIQGVVSCGFEPKFIVVCGCHLLAVGPVAILY